MVGVNIYTMDVPAPGFMLTVLSLIIEIAYVQGTCTFPSTIRGTWVRSRDTKTLTFTQSDILGMDIKYNSQDLGTFSCRINAGDVFVLSSNTYSTTIEDKRYYVCWKMRQVTHSAYILYELSDTVADASYQGEPGIIESVTSNSTVTLGQVCIKNANKPHFTTLIRKDATIISVSSQCPSQLIARYSYALCPNTVLDFCSGPTTVRANYSQCATQIFNSAVGVLSCMGHVSQGSDTYLNLVRHDAGNVVTCFKFQAVSERIITGQYYSGDCSTSSVMSLTLTKTDDCSSASDSSDEGTSIITGVIVAVIVLVVVLIIILLIVRKKLSAPITVPQDTSIKPTENQGNISSKQPEKLENRSEESKNQEIKYEEPENQEIKYEEPENQEIKYEETEKPEHGYKAQNAKETGNEDAHNSKDGSIKQLENGRPVEHGHDQNHA